MVLKKHKPRYLPCKPRFTENYAHTYLFVEDMFASKTILLDSGRENKGARI